MSDKSFDVHELDNSQYAIYFGILHALRLSFSNEERLYEAIYNGIKDAFASWLVQSAIKDGIGGALEHHLETLHGSKTTQVYAPNGMPVKDKAMEMFSAIMAHSKNERR